MGFTVMTETCFLPHDNLLVPPSEIFKDFPVMNWRLLSLLEFIAVRIAFVHL